MTGVAFAVEHLSSGTPAAARPTAAAVEVSSMRQRIELMRDVLISLGMQLVFRATILLRHWA